MTDNQSKDRNPCGEIQIDSYVTAIDKIWFQGAIKDYLRQTKKATPDGSRDSKGKTWRDRPPLL